MKKPRAGWGVDYASLILNSDLPNKKRIARLVKPAILAEVTGIGAGPRMVRPPVRLRRLLTMDQ